MKRISEPAPVMREEGDGLPIPRRYWALAALWIATTVAVLDSSIANIALPTIAQEFGVTPAASIWVVNAYQIAVAMLLLPVASAGEIIGHHRVYMASLVLFGLSSLGCALADGLTLLSIARFVQGMAGAGIMAINAALLRLSLPRDRLGTMIGYHAIVVAVGTAAGPSIAAGILAIGSWRWLFAINIPLVLASLSIAVWALPTPAGAARRFDMPSALLNILTFAAIFLTASDLARGHGSGRTAATAIIGLLGGFALVHRARRQEAPLIPLDLMAQPALRLAYAVSGFAFAAFAVALVGLPFLLQSRFGLSHVEVGLTITPMAVGTALTAPVAGRLANDIASALLCRIGMALTAVAMLAIQFLPATAGAVPVGAILAIAGIGFGLFQTPNNRTMLTLAPVARSGAAAGMLATMRLTGQTIGAVLAAFLLQVAGPGGGAILLAATGLSLASAAMTFLHALSPR